jgi:hypothetical protein
MTRSHRELPLDQVRLLLLLLQTTQHADGPCRVVVDQSATIGARKPCGRLGASLSWWCSSCFCFPW